jgi:hypothetical protein
MTRCASGIIRVFNAKNRQAANCSVKPMSAFLQTKKAATTSAIVRPMPRRDPTRGVRLIVYQDILVHGVEAPGDG